MSILVDRNTRVVVQGATGREAILRIRLMGTYGTAVLAGVTPGKGGQIVEGIPVFDTVLQAREAFPELNTSAIFVPAAAAKLAAFEALEAGISLISLHPERVPQQDMLEIIAYARRYRCHVIGPNTIGIISPDKALVGMIGGNARSAKEFFSPGPVGVLSRSGGSTTTVAFYLNRVGLGQTTAVSMGGDAFVGTNLCEFLELFNLDSETKLIAYFGEIGTSIEEDAALLMQAGKFSKPVVAYIAGRYARPDMRFGHAGAMISRGVGTADDKRDALRSAGVHVAEHLGDIGSIAARLAAED